MRSRAYYNEHDRAKAAWLRELISRGLIAPGDVDERSIADVWPNELVGYTQCHFFAGIGIWSYALRLAGWPDDRECWTGSCPCQPFSAAGQRKGTKDSRHLWPEFARLIQARKPLVVFGEQVASKDGLAWFQNVEINLDHSGYTVGAVDSCAAGFGAPHWRQRLYFVGALGMADSEHSVWRPELQEYGDSYGRDGSERGGNSGRLAHMPGDGCREERPDSRGISPGNGTQGRTPGSDAGGEPGRLGDSDRTRLEIRGRESRHSGSECETTERASDSGRVDDSAGSRCLGEIGGTEGSPRDETRMRVSGSGGDADRLGHSECSERREDLREPGGSREEEGRNQGPDRTGESGQARGPVNGFWRDSDWVLTRPQRVGDRPGLRPVEPGSFPLVNGAPQRVGRLRGYGDGIVAPQAAEFIRAYMEIVDGMVDETMDTVEGVA